MVVHWKRVVCLSESGIHIGCTLLKTTIKYPKINKYMVGQMMIN